MKTYIAALALATSIPVPAAQPAPVDGLLACASIVDTAARLECFDRSAAAARRAQAPAALPPPAPPLPATPSARPAPPAAATKPPDTAASTSFGSESLPQRAPSEASAEMLQARIVETRKATGGRYLVVLDNGQIWRHDMGSMAPYLLVGEAVTIRKASLGSYRLTLDSSRSSNWVRVTRIQ